MKKVLLALSLLFATLAASASPYRLAIANDHTNLLYRIGETATFTVTVTDTNGVPVKEGVIPLTLDNFGPKVQVNRQVDLSAGNPFAVTGRLDEPGFLRLTVPLKGERKPFVWSVGYEPEKIRKGSPSPEDFDEFWASARAKLSKEVPADVQVSRIAERSTEAFDYYRISLATYGRRVYGYMSVPTDKTKAPFAAEFQVAAAGFGGWTNDMKGQSDRIQVFFSVYPFEPDWRWQKTGLEKKYDAMNRACREKFGESVNYCRSGISESCEDYFFYPVLLGIDRAVDWVAARPDVDKDRFWYQGTSQGGGFGFYLTGLNRHFTRAVMFVPAITDTLGFLKGRQSGWPQIVESNGPACRERVLRYAPYFDGANFASRIRCPVRVVVGFADTTCAPCAVYAAYNEIRVKDKGILHGFGMTHDCFGNLYTKGFKWLRK